MLSFGQRIKMLRNECELSQAELAEKLGVSVQSVSKWECDAYYPDVSILLPLAAILGVTTDCLLGAGTNEKKDREELDRELAKIAENDATDSDDAFHMGYNANKKSYEATKNFLKKYPLNYEVRLYCVKYLLYYLYDSTWPSAYEIPSEEFDILYGEGVKMAKSIINGDRDPSRLIEARRALTIYYCMKEKWDEAEATAMEIPDVAGLRKDSLGRIAGERRDLDRALENRKERCSELADAFMSSLLQVGRRTSIFGDERKNEAIKAWTNAKKAAYLCVDIFSEYGPEEYRNKADYLFEAMAMISNDNLAINKTENALAALEEATETALKIYGDIKEMGAPEEFLQELREEYQDIPQMCRDRVYANDDNPLSKHPRTELCRKKLEELS